MRRERERERESCLLKRETEHLWLSKRERERELFIEEGNRTPVAKAGKDTIHTRLGT